MTVRRRPVVVVVVAALVIAVLAGDGSGVPARSPQAAAVEATSAPPSGIASAAWFCPGPPATIAPEAQFLAVANNGADPASVVATIHPDGGGAPVVSTVEVDPASVAAPARADLGPPGGIVVETSSADVAVELGVRGPGQLAPQPCASTTARDWHVPAGTTVRGVEQWLTLYNPLGTDAKVDVTFRTDEGVQTPNELSSFDVPRRSRVVVPLHDSAVRKARVATHVRAGIGRVVVEQTMVFTEASGTRGVTRSIGTPALRPEWTFAAIETRAGLTSVVAIVNPNVVTADVDVIVTGPEAAVDPVTVRVPSDAVTWVQFGGCTEPPSAECVPVPPEAAFSVALTTDANTPVAAELLARATAEGGGGAAASLGAVADATQWLVPYAKATDGATVALAIANPGAAAVRAGVWLLRDGAEQPADLADLEIAPGAAARVDLTPHVAGTRAALVMADGGVVVERTFGGGDELAHSAGIPVRQ